MILLSGKVIDSRIKTLDGGNSTVPSAKIFVSNEFGEITPKKIITQTDEKGNYTLSLPSTLVQGLPIPFIDGKYLTVSVPTLVQGTNKKITVPLKGTNSYNFDIASLGKSGSLDEVTVSAKKNPPSPKVKTPSWKYFMIGGSVLIAIVIGTVIYKQIKK